MLANRRWLYLLLLCWLAIPATNAQQADSPLLARAATAVVG
jgi:hypothetical protein